MFILGFIPDDTLINKKNKSLPISEAQYWTNHMEDFKYLNCPNCKESGGLFKGFHSIGCYTCLTYHGVDDVIGAN